VPKTGGLNFCEILPESFHLKYRELSACNINIRLPLPLLILAVWEVVCVCVKTPELRALK